MSNRCFKITDPDGEVGQSVGTILKKIQGLEKIFKELKNLHVKLLDAVFNVITALFPFDLL